MRLSLRSFGFNVFTIGTACQSNETIMSGAFSTSRCHPPSNGALPDEMVNLGVYVKMAN